MISEIATATVIVPDANRPRENDEAASPDVARSQAIRELNEQLARKINDEARANPQSAFAGKFVGLANGQVVVVADTLDEMSRRLDEIELDPAKAFWVEASRDYSEVDWIWELHSCPA